MIDFLICEQRICLLKTVWNPLICDLPEIKIVIGSSIEKWNSGFWLQAQSYFHSILLDIRNILF